MLVNRNICVFGAFLAFRVTLTVNVMLQHESEKQLAGKLMYVQRGYLINNMLSTQTTDYVNMIQCS